MFNRVPGRSVFGPAAFPDHSNHAVNSEMHPELLELLALQTKEPQSSAVQESDWPVSIFIPERYEENYAYPLLVWFHDNGYHEGQVENVLRAISPQNYCGLGIRGNQPLPHDDLFAWNIESLEYGPVTLRDLLGVTIRRMRQAFHIHSERIFLGGCGTGADVALQQLALSSNWYAGGVIFNPECSDSVLDRLSEAAFEGQSVLWTIPRNASNDTLARSVDAVQLARLAGMKPDIRLTDEPISPTGSASRFVDHWLLSKMGGQVMV